MRRRIYIDPESDLRDDTGRPYGWDIGRANGLRLEWCDTGALYDDDLWEQYVAACEATSKLRRLVLEAMHPEPFDDVERELHRRAHDNMDTDDGYSADLDDELSRLALEHAAKQERPGCGRPARDGKEVG